MGYIEDAVEAKTTPGLRRVLARRVLAGEKRDLFNSLSVRRAGWFWAEPGCVLEYALRAGVVDKLLAPDKTLLHRKLAPGAQAVWEVC